MKHVGREAAALLNGAGIELSEGLTDAEYDSVHERFGFHFNPDHRSLLATALPLGDRWPNWRSADDLELGTWLDVRGTDVSYAMPAVSGGRSSSAC